MVLSYKIRLTEDMLASSPAQPKVYEQYIASKKRDELPTDEIDTLPAEKVELAGWSVFHKDEKGIFLFDYHIRGFLKEAASAITGKDITAVRSKIDKWLFVFPRRIYFLSNDRPIADAEGNMERPLRAMTMQGPRVSIKRSDVVLAGAELQFEVHVLPKGQTDFKPKVIESWLEYGKLCGLGEWRSGSWGRFEVVQPVTA